MQKEINNLEDSQDWVNAQSSPGYLSLDEEKALIIKAQKNDASAMHDLVVAFTSFVGNLAEAMSGYQLPKEDLVSEGNIGLIKAIKAFDTSRATRLSSFAYHYIRAEMNEFITRNFSIVKRATTKDKRKLFFSIRRRISTLSTQYPLLERNELIRSIADEMNMTFEDVNEMASYMLHHDSVYEELSSDKETPSSFTLLHAEQKNTTMDFHQPEAFLFAEREKESVEAFIDKIPTLLTEKQYDIFESRLLRDKEEALTLKQLAERYAVSKERVRQIESKARKILQGAMH